MKLHEITLYKLLTFNGQPLCLQNSNTNNFETVQLGMCLIFYFIFCYLYSNLK